MIQKIRSFIIVILAIFLIITTSDLFFRICSWDGKGSDQLGSHLINQCPIGLGWYGSIIASTTHFLSFTFLSLLTITFIVWLILTLLAKDFKRISTWTIPAMLLATFYTVEYRVDNIYTGFQKNIEIQRMANFDTIATSLPEKCLTWSEGYLTKEYGAVTRNNLGVFIRTSSIRNQNDNFVLHIPKGFFTGKAYVVLSPKNSWNGDVSAGRIDGIWGNHFGTYFDSAVNSEKILIPNAILFPLSQYDVRFFRIPESSVTIDPNNHWATVKNFETTAAKIFPNSTDCASVGLR